MFPGPRTPAPQKTSPDQSEPSSLSQSKTQPLSPPLTQPVSQSLDQSSKDSPGLSPTLHTGVQQFSNAITTPASLMLRNLRERTPTVDGLSSQAKQGLDKASSDIDRSVRDVTTTANNGAREMLKREHAPSDWMVTRLQKTAHNWVVDKVFDNSQRIIDVTGGYASGVAGKIGSTTADRFNPMHVATLARNPEMAKLYGQQRWDQITQLVSAYYDPKGFAKTKSGQLYNSMLNLRDRAGSVDSLSHGGRAAVDFTQEKIAPLIGAGLVSFGLFNLPRPRANTNQAMDRMFPRGSVHGTFARFPATKFFLTKPIARVVGNPWMAGALLTYGLATSLGKRIEDREELTRRAPDTARRLKENNRDMTGSSGQLDIINSIKKTGQSKL